MSAYAAGDERAFTRLFSNVAPSVYRFFLRSFRDRSLCDELLQTTFFRVHRGRATYRSGLPLRPWLFTIAAHVRRDELRRRFRLREDAGEEALAAAEEAHARDESQDADKAAVDGDIAARVRAALDGLPESQRVVIQLHRFESMPFAQIAEASTLTETDLLLLTESDPLADHGQFHLAVAFLPSLRNCRGKMRRWVRWPEPGSIEPGCPQPGL